MDRLSGTLTGLNQLSGTLTQNNQLSGTLTNTPGEGTRNYNRLTNKPMINGVELMGDKSFEELGDTPLTNIEIKALFDRVFND